jgi:hypothetical protein
MIFLDDPPSPLLHHVSLLGVLERSMREKHGSRTSWEIVCEIPISKITTGKWTGGVAQTVEQLFCKHEALSSNPPTKKINISQDHGINFHYQ